MSRRRLGSHCTRQADWNHEPKRVLRCARPTTFLPSASSTSPLPDPAKQTKPDHSVLTTPPRLLDRPRRPSGVEGGHPRRSEPVERAPEVGRGERVVCGEPQVDPHRIHHVDHHRASAGPTSGERDTPVAGADRIHLFVRLGRAEHDAGTLRLAHRDRSGARVRVDRRPPGVQGTGRSHAALDPPARRDQAVSASRSGSPTPR